MTVEVVAARYDEVQIPGCLAHGCCNKGLIVEAISSPITNLLSNLAIYIAGRIHSHGYQEGRRRSAAGQGELMQDSSPVWAI